jgi:pSer/pThr/pTyr-binding forkhead associated (FHA) protein
MLDADALINHSLNKFSTPSSDDPDLCQRLGLYQVFIKLYEHNKSLLDEILSLENSGSRALASVTRSYMQAFVLNGQVYLITNLLNGSTQALTQPDHIWTLGRDPKQVVVPIADSRLSRCHAVIRYIDEGFYLTDLGSSNGSFVNGEPVRANFRLKDGDRIRLGALTFNFFICQTMQSLATVPPEIVTRIEANEARYRISQRSTPVVGPKKEDDQPRHLPADETLQFMRSKTA